MRNFVGLSVIAALAATAVQDCSEVQALSLAGGKSGKNRRRLHHGGNRQRGTKKHQHLRKNDKHWEKAQLLLKTDVNNETKQNEKRNSERQTAPSVSAAVMRPLLFAMQWQMPYSPPTSTESIDPVWGLSHPYFPAHGHVNAELLEKQQALEAAAERVRAAELEEASGEIVKSSIARALGAVKSEEDAANAKLSLEVYDSAVHNALAAAKNQMLADQTARAQNFVDTTNAILKYGPWDLEAASWHRKQAAAEQANLLHPPLLKYLFGNRAGENELTEAARQVTQAAKSETAARKWLEEAKEAKRSAVIVQSEQRRRSQHAKFAKEKKAALHIQASEKRRTLTTLMKYNRLQKQTAEAKKKFELARDAEHEAAEQLKKATSEHDGFAEQMDDMISSSSTSLQPSTARQYLRPEAVAKEAHDVAKKAHDIMVGVANAKAEKEKKETAWQDAAEAKRNAAEIWWSSANEWLSFRHKNSNRLNSARSVSSMSNNDSWDSYASAAWQSAFEPEQALWEALDAVNDAANKSQHDEEYEYTNGADGVIGSAIRSMGTSLGMLIR